MSFHARHGGGGGSPHRGAGYPPSGSPPPCHYVEDDVEDNPFEQPTSSASRHYPPQQQDRHSQPQQFAPHRGGDYRSHSEPKGHLPPHGPLSSSSSSPSVSFHSNVRQGAPSPHSEREGRSPSHTQQQYHHPQPQHHAGKEGGSDGAGNIVPILLRRMDEMQRSFQQENQDLRQEVQQLRMMLQELLTHHQNNSPTRGASPTNGGYDSESSAGGMRLKVDPNRRSCHLCRKEYNIQIAAQHFEGKTHKQQLRKLLDEQNWDELRRQAELARASGVVTTAEFYGRCANQRVEDHHHYPHHQPSNSSARQPQPQQQYRSLSPHTHSHQQQQQQYPPHSAAQDPHRAHHHHHSSSSPLHSSSHAAAGGGGSSFHPFAGFVSNGGNFGAHRTAVGGGGSPSAAGGGYSPRSQY